MATVRKGKRSRTARSSRPRNAGRRGSTGRRISDAAVPACCASTFQAFLYQEDKRDGSTSTFFKLAA